MLNDCGIQPLSQPLSTTLLFFVIISLSTNRTLTLVYLANRIFTLVYLANRILTLVYLANRILTQVYLANGILTLVYLANRILTVAYLILQTIDLTYFSSCYTWNGLSYQSPSPSLIPELNCA